MSKQPGDAVRRSLILRRLAKKCADAKFFGDLSNYYAQLAQQGSKASGESAASARELGVIIGLDEAGEQLSKALDANQWSLATMRDEEIVKLQEEHGVNPQPPADEPVEEGKKTKRSGPKPLRAASES